MQHAYHILPVNSRGYYKFQAEIGVATNQEFYIEIARKVLIYGFQPCTTWQPPELRLLTDKIR